MSIDYYKKALDFQLNESRFANYKIEDKSSGFKSYFTDEESISLLFKISNRSITKLVNEFQSIKTEVSDRQLHLKVYLHKICNALLEKFGSKLLTFIYTLPVIEYDNTQVENVYEISDNENISEMNFYNFFAPEQKLAFGLDEIEYEDGRKLAYLAVCDRNGRLLYRINKEGKIDESFIRLIGRLKLHIFEVNIENKIEIYSSIFNATCSICNIPLTDPTSIFYGKGKVCRGK